MRDPRDSNSRHFRINYFMEKLIRWLLIMFRTGHRISYDSISIRQELQRQHLTLQVKKTEILKWFFTAWSQSDRQGWWKICVLCIIRNEPVHICWFNRRLFTTRLSSSKCPNQANRIKDCINCVDKIDLFMRSIKSCLQFANYKSIYLCTFRVKEISNENWAWKRESVELWDREVIDVFFACLYRAEKSVLCSHAFALSSYSSSAVCHCFFCSSI